MDNEPSLDERFQEEFDRINNLLNEAGVSDKKIRIMQPVIENTAWMKVKLDDSRLAVKNSQIVISYDNGGGQKGIRENPLFKGYESLWKSYMHGMQKIIECIPDDNSNIKKEELDKPLSMLEVVRARKKA